jgi:mannose-1-phosphate guanylyltransferase
VKALILAAGKGSRLGAERHGVPKPLMDVGGTTPLERNARWVAAVARDGIWINVHEGADLIRQRMGHEVDDVPIEYSWEPELLGTAGAWKHLEREWTDTSLVVYGDNFMHFHLAGLLQAHRAAGALATIAIYDPAINGNTGIGGGRVLVAEGRVTRFVEGATEGLVNAGVYCLEPPLAARLEPGFSDFGRDVLPRLAEEGVLAAHRMEAEGYCLGLDTPETLARARRIAAEGNERAGNMEQVK